MKITIAPVTSGPSWGAEVSLTTGLDKSPQEIVYNGSNIVDMVQVLQSATQTPIDRGNQASTITFKFTNDNSTILASEQDLILYFATLPRFGKITFYGETALTTPYAYMVAKLDLSHSQIGVATIRSITLTGGPITTSAPTAPLPYP